MIIMCLMIVTVDSTMVVLILENCVVLAEEAVAPARRGRHHPRHRHHPEDLLECRPSPLASARTRRRRSWRMAVAAWTMEGRMGDRNVLSTSYAGLVDVYSPTGVIVVEVAFVRPLWRLWSNSASRPRQPPQRLPRPRPPILAHRQRRTSAPTVAAAVIGNLCARLLGCAV